jgi:hypothetical protein
MSMVRCDDCEHLFDSDDDPECFQPLPYGVNYRLTAIRTVCEFCRDDMECNEAEVDAA